MKKTIEAKGIEIAIISRNNEDDRISVNLSNSIGIDRIGLQQ